MLVFLVCVCTSVQPCYASHVIVPICLWVSDINAVRLGTSQVPSPYKTKKSWFVYSLVDLVSIVLSKIPSLPLSQSCIHWTPLWNYLLSAAFGTDWMAVSWKCKKTNIKFQIPLTVEQDMLSSFDWYILLVLCTFHIKSSLNFFVQECTFVDNLLCISSMNARHDWQNLVFVPDNCCWQVWSEGLTFLGSLPVAVWWLQGTAKQPPSLSESMPGVYVAPTGCFFKLLRAQGVMGKLNIVVLLDNLSQLSLTPFSKNAARPANLWSVWLRAGTKDRHVGSWKLLTIILWLPCAD